MRPPENANARRQPGERAIVTDFVPSLATSASGVNLIWFAMHATNAQKPSAPQSRKERDAATYGPPELCAWQIAPGVFWIQTTEPRFSRKLEKRRDARRVEISGVNHFRRTFEIRGRRRKIQRVIDRYLDSPNEVSAGDRFLRPLRPEGASKPRGSMSIAAASYRQRKASLVTGGAAL